MQLFLQVIGQVWATCFARGYCWCISLSRKNVVDMILTMNCYPKNGQFSDPDFTHHNLQHPILGCSIKQQYNSIVVLRTRLIRVQLQHPVKQVGLTIYSMTSQIRSSDNIINKMQKACNGNPSLKSTDLLQAQRFIESLSISTDLVPCSLMKVFPSLLVL